MAHCETVKQILAGHIFCRSESLGLLNGACETSCLDSFSAVSYLACADPSKQQDHFVREVMVLRVHLG